MQTVMLGVFSDNTQCLLILRKPAPGRPGLEHLQCPPQSFSRTMQIQVACWDMRVFKHNHIQRQKSVFGFKESLMDIEHHCK